MTLSVILAVQVRAEKREKVPEARYYMSQLKRQTDKHTYCTHTEGHRTILFYGVLNAMQSLCRHRNVELS